MGDGGAYQNKMYHLFTHCLFNKLWTPEHAGFKHWGNMHSHGGGAKVSALTPKEMAFYATPAEPFVPEEPPVFDATPTPNIRGVLSFVCIEDAGTQNS
jgi:hypothetical protein